MRARRVEHDLTPGVPFGDVVVLSGPEPLLVQVHDGIEVGVVLSGNVERHFETHVELATAGDVWLCAMWEPHGRRVVSSRFEGVLLIFQPDFLGDEAVESPDWLRIFAALPEFRPRVAGSAMRAKVLAIGQELRREVELKQPRWETAVRLDLLLLLFTLSRTWKPPALGGRAVGPSSNLRRVMPALALVQDNGRARISIPEAAAACGLGRSRFSLLFREAMGMGFSQFGLRARLARVAEMLIGTDLATEDIAAEYGFVDASHLHRTFVRHYGATPAAYRRRAR